MNDDDNRPKPGQLREEAAWWFAHMRGPEAASDRDDFEHWLARGALHRAAYNRVAERFAEGKHLKEFYRAQRRRRLAMIGAGVALLAGLYPALSILTDRNQQPAVSAAGHPEQFVTLVGQVRALKLLDGSRILLDSDSLIAVRFDAQRRMIDLRRGRARFEVAHEARPFTVVANAIEVTATGTLFDVSLASGAIVDVHLIRGTVGVARRSATAAVPGQPPIILRAGQSARLGDDGHLARSVAEPAATMWPSLRVEFNRTRLGEVVARANRYSIEMVVVADPSVADRTVSGTFRIDNAQLLADRLATLFDLEVDRSVPGVITLRARQQE